MLYHFTAHAMRSCSSSIPPDDVSVEKAEVGKPSDVVASSVNEVDIDSLMDIVEEWRDKDDRYLNKETWDNNVEDQFKFYLHGKT